MFDPNYAAKITLLLSKEPRFTGTPGEERARKIIAEEFEKMGYVPQTEHFSTKIYKINKVSLESIAPYRKEYEVSAVGFSGTTPDEGVTGDLVYIENTCRALIPEKDEWIGLVSTRPSKEEWKFLAGKASAIIIAEGNPYRHLSRVSIPYEWREKFGNLPAVYVKFDDAFELLNVEKVRVVLEQEIVDTTAYNVVAEKRGYKYPEEIVLVTAHYDSVYGVKGAVDNAGGTAFVLALAKALSNARVKRTVRFILFSGEELGLRGSLAYIERHKKELEDIRLVVNLDVHGGMPGFNSAIVTGPKSLSSYVESLSKKIGVNMKVNNDIMSSDGTSFAWKEIPVVNFYRSSGAGVDMHTIRDDERYIHPKAYELLGEIVYRFLVDVLNAEEFMFPKQIPDDLKKKVEEYFKKRLGIVED